MDAIHLDEIERHTTKREAATVVGDAANSIAPYELRDIKTTPASDRRAGKGTRMNIRNNNDNDDAAANAIRKMRDFAPTALEAVRETARNGPTAEVRTDAKAWLEERGFTVDGDEPYTFTHDPRVDD